MWKYVCGEHWTRSNVPQQFLYEQLVYSTYWLLSKGDLSLRVVFDTGLTV